jgi:hypothetical protein
VGINLNKKESDGDRKALGRTWRRPLNRIDGRSQIARRIKSLTQALMKQAGETDAFRRAQIRTASELMVMAEVARFDALQNGGRGLDVVLKAEDRALSSINALGLKGAPDAEPLSLAGYLARKG